MFDYFYVFVAGAPPKAYLVPMEAFEATGLDAVFGALEEALGGKLHCALANSTGYRSSVMWPERFAGRPVVEFIEVPVGGLVGKIFGRSRIEFRFTTELSEGMVDGTPVWAA